MNKQEALFKYVLRLGDNSVVLAQRLCEWTGVGPFLEEDLALTNISLDIFGQGRNLLEYAGRIEGKGRTEDTLAFHRNDREYFNFLICEQSNGDYAKTIMRQALIDCFDFLYYSELLKSSDETIRAIAEKSIKEITYHKRHSFSWVKRFGGGTDESKERAQNALNELWRFTGEFFEKDEVDELMIKERIAPDVNKLKDQWEKEINNLLSEAGLKIPTEVFMQMGGRKGIHTEQLGYLLNEMQSLPRMYPEAKW
ncbi:MAG: phenylacetate-CoA oxygenase subunit PaaC [Sphingobacteriaceae bacterium]|nr:phenylacetate-CoA oxygenase subunit PaaC [Sphingobacteriaceae bacterium]